MSARFTLEQVRAIQKPRDAWWTVILVDPLASRLVPLVAGRRWITPNRLTVFAFVLGLAAAACFALADYRWLVAGAVFYHLSFVVDCMDGKVARLTGTGSVFGAWLDYIFDRLRVVACTIALMGGQYAATHNVAYLIGGGVVVGLDMFRYLNALEIYRVKTDMRNELAELTGATTKPAFVEEVLPEVPAEAEATEADLARAEAVDAAGQGRAAAHRQAIVDLHDDFRERFGFFIHFRNFLIRRRIRAHVISGIEFQMAVFVVAPIAGADSIVPITAVAGTILLIFEIALSYKLYLSTSAFARKRASLLAQNDEQRTDRGLVSPEVR